MGRFSGSNLTGVGNILSTTLFLASGGLLLVILWRLWRQYEPSDGGRAAPSAHAGLAARIAGLPEGAALESTDAWDEANRRRGVGDRAGAVVWLFLGQLILLQRAGLLRLTPGRTARQYVSGLEDRELRDSLGTTLGLFEDVYYGNRLPTPEALEAAWTRAEGLRRSCHRRGGSDEGRSESVEHGPARGPLGRRCHGAAAVAARMRPTGARGERASTGRAPSRRWSRARGTRSGRRFGSPTSSPSGPT